MKLRKFCLGLLMLPAVMFAENLPGRYRVSGYDPTSNPPEYVGFVEIKSHEAALAAPDTHPDDYYTIEWTYQGFQSIRGTGVRKNNFISFVFTGNEDPAYNGVQLYRIEEDEEKHGHHQLTLEGPWILTDDNSIGKETLTKIHH